MFSKSLFSTLFLIVCGTASAQDSIPRITGKVIISIKNGTFECDLTLSNIPRVKDYLIRINSGMNIRNFSDQRNNMFYYERSLEDSLSDETNAYVIRGESGQGKYLPVAIRFQYGGMFPVFTDTINNYAVNDWKGNIAFNGYSVRTDGSQSAWHPILYDIQKDKKYDELTYDIEVVCTDCTTLYINGNTPQSEPRAHFKSEKARPMMLFCGDYSYVSSSNGTYILNPDLDDQQIASFCTMTDSYKSYYERKLGIPYKDAITYINTTPVSKNNAWLFVTYPTIVTIGHGKYGMKTFFDKDTGEMFKPFIAHELAHYYFGSYQKFNTPLGDMMLEGFSEFLALKAAKSLISKAVYENKINGKLKRLEDFSAVPFAKVKSVDDLIDRELYVYYYAPVLFTAIEKEIGERCMWNWMNAILTTKTEFTDYNFLTGTLRKTLKDDVLINSIVSKYFASENAFELARTTIQQ
ncbi:MAG TPA: hypothetical protein VF676_07165 [Flavobacterium sp.]|jgi:hypothetical protein